MLTSLEVKTSYSILGSLNKIEALVSRAKELGYSSLAITDTNNMFGTYEFYLTCLKYNIKPIIGIEVLFDDKRFILLAKNNNGYKNLIKLYCKIMIISRHFCKIKNFLHALGNFFTSFHGFDYGAAEAFFF